MSEMKQGSIHKIISKCWEDEAFKQELIADPAPVLRGEGLEFQEGIAIRVLEDTQSLIHLVLPPPPSKVLDDSNLVGLQGGRILWSGCSVLFDQGN